MGKSYITKSCSVKVIFRKLCHKKIYYKSYIITVLLTVNSKIIRVIFLLWNTEHETSFTAPPPKN